MGFKEDIVHAIPVPEMIAQQALSLFGTSLSTGHTADPEDLSGEAADVATLLAGRGPQGVKFGTTRQCGCFLVGKQTKLNGLWHGSFSLIT